MSLEQIRQDLTNAVQVIVPTFSEYVLNVGYENRELIDPARQSNPYLEVEVQFGPAWQADLAPNPIHRISGLLILTAKVREGGGSGAVNRLLDHFYPKLQRRRIGISLLDMASFPKAATVKGIYSKSVVLPFVADKTYGV